MPADAFSSILGWLEMGTGNDNNTWGTNWNNSVGLILESAIAGFLSHAVTGGTLDLSGTPPPAGPSGAIEAQHKFTGILLSTQTVIFPNNSRIYFVRNATTGSFGLLAKVAGGTAVNCPAGRTTVLYCDGALGCERHDKEEVGGYVQHASNVPPGTFECSGGTKLVADYPDLFAKLSTTYGGNGVTTFGLPNLTDTARYLRSRSGSVTLATSQSNQNKSHTHSVSSGTITTGIQSANHTHSGTTAGGTAHQHDAFIGDDQHTHSGAPSTALGALGQSGSTAFAYSGSSATSASTGVKVRSTAGSAATADNKTAAESSHTHTITTGNQSADHTHNFSFTVTSATGSADGTEARPESLACITCIRY